MESLQGATLHPSALASWITSDPAYQSLRLGPRHTLQVISAHCDTLRPDGLIGASGGAALARAIGISKRTLWRHIAKLEALGYIVAIWRGGTMNGVNIANRYGVPASRGAMAHRKRPRRMQVMTPNARGKLAPQHIPAGDQVPLFDQPPPPDTQKKRNSDPRKGLGHIHAEDLTDDTRMISLYKRAVSAGLYRDCEHHRHTFVSLVEHALAVADNPPALFAKMVKLGGDGMLYLTIADDEAARRRLRGIDGLSAPPQPKSPSEAIVAKPEPRPELAPNPESDARTLRFVQSWAAKHRPGQSAGDLLKAKGWPDARISAAIRQSDGSKPEVNRK